MGMIDELYFGELHFDKLYKQGSEFGTLIHMLDQADDFIYEHLSPDDKRVYCRIRTVAAEVLATAELAQFKNGFRAGAQFALETFREDDTPFNTPPENEAEYRKMLDWRE